MEYTTLGKTGLKISRMGFGGIPIQRIDAEGTRNLMKELVKNGVNYIDTARGYTVSEEYLGYALEGIRDKFVVATKSMSRTKETMAADIETSLRNLRTDYIDLYQIHNPSMEQLDTVAGPDALGEKCGGNFRYTEKGIKDCTNCQLPHKRKNYGYVTGKYQELAAMMQKIREQDHK